MVLPDKYSKFIEIMVGYCDGFDEETGGHNYRLYHQLRVADAAYQIFKSGEFADANEKIVVIGGLFHDIGRIYILKQNDSKTLKFDRKELDKQKGHEELSKQVISEILKNDLTTQEIEKVCSAIDRSSDHYNRTAENKILYDADFLDELGVLNLFRMFTYSGTRGRTIEETVKYWFEVDKKLKMSKIDKCFTNYAKDEALRRIALQDKIMLELQNGGFEIKED